MGRWRPLPHDLPIEVARLVRDMRRHVDRSGVTVATLASKSGYSRSSWVRYLNGHRLPPWAAVAGLGRLTHADWEQLHVRWESAAHAWAPPQRGGGTDPEPAAAAAPRQETPRQETPGSAGGGATTDEAATDEAATDEAI
ncbi:Helix-turn-helix domain-containing protein, partial [Streptomyces sp. DvalAA-14]|uniref:helix-turn-helix domain-containing protein n=1 Tax=unclassified Streptomyces TaxID=2593676 RepID=UPI00081BBA38